MANRISAIELAELLDGYSQRLALYASQWTRFPDDCVQEALMELAKRPERPERPIAWLYKVVRSRALNANRSEKRRRANEQQAAKIELAISDPASKMQEDEQQRELISQLKKLDEGQRELVILRIWSELTWQEIAELTVSSSSSAQRNYVAALDTLRARLTNYSMEP